MGDHDGRVRRGQVGGASVGASSNRATDPSTGAVGARTLIDALGPAPSSVPRPAVTPPKGGIDQPGFIDNSEGANIRTGPAEKGGQTLREQPLPPATRVFVSGTHPEAPAWWYVTAYLDGTMVRGYVQDFRVTTRLPEPTAKLHQVILGTLSSNSRPANTAVPCAMATTFVITKTSCST